MALSQTSFLFLLAILSISPQGVMCQDDERCLLESGGSTLRFLASEDLEIGDIIGKLGVKGRVGEDIELSLGDNDNNTLRLETRNGSSAAWLVLGEGLDREGVTGPSGVRASLSCIRSGAGDTDPGYVIPINVRVTDVNDNAPLFLGAPYNITISEATPLGTEVLRVEAVDADQRGPFSSVQYRLEDGAFSDILNIDREGVARLARSLDYDEGEVSMRLRLVASDQGQPPLYTQTWITLNIEDADDHNPEFLQDRYEAVLPSSAEAGSELTVLPEAILARDRDLGLNSSLVYSLPGARSEAERLVTVDPRTGILRLVTNVTEDRLRQPLTLIVQATQGDNPDRYSITTLTLTRERGDTSLLSSPAPSLSFTQRVYSASVLESMPVGSTVLTLVTSRLSSPDHELRFKIGSDDLPGGQFGVDEKGDLVIRRQLDFEDTTQFSFRVMVEDARENDTAMINISVINVNDWDPRFKYPQYEFYVEAGGSLPGHIVGEVEVFDGDTGDSISLELSGRSSRAFRITQEGEIFISDLSYMKGTEAHLVVTAEDSGSPPRRASVPVVVTFERPQPPGARELVDEAPDMMVILLISVTSVFILIIICLGVVIFKTKRRLKASTPTLSSSDSDSMYLQQSSAQYPSQVGSVNLSYKLDQSLTARSNSAHTRPSSAVSDKSGVTLASLISVSQAPTSLLSNVSSVATDPAHAHSSQLATLRKGVQVRHRSNKVTPADLEANINSVGLPSLDKARTGQSPADSSLQSELKTNILQVASKDSGKRLEWPRASIPRTVKKLSWDDEREEDRVKDRMEDREVTSVMMDVTTAITPEQRGRQRLTGDTMYLQT